MARFLKATVAALLACAGWAGGEAALGAANAAAQSPQGLTAFRSDAELVRFLKQRREAMADLPAPPPPPPMPSPPPPPSPMAPGSMVAPPVVAAAATANDTITNNQVAGVDEGGIVKVVGDHLVILRRGRLFTVSTAGGGLRPVHAIDAFPPGTVGRGAWYDEVLVSRDQVIVIGFSYDRGGTEINRFRLGPDGRLSFIDAHHLRSDDYYSSRNYASRVVGDTLVLYAPLDLYWDDEEGETPLTMLPGIRRWTGDEEAAFTRLTSAREIYISPQLRGSRDPVDALHTVTRCDLSRPEFRCRSMGVLGPASRTFFVSSNAVYLWTHEHGGWSWLPQDDDPAADAALYRFPLDGSRPQAVRTRGAPMDQMSFQADVRRGALNILVQSTGTGDAMWNPEFQDGALALLRLPMSRFGDGQREAPRSDYRLLPSLPDGAWDRRNRFVDRHLLYSGHGRAGIEWVSRLVATNIDTGSSRTWDLQTGVSRIEQLGQDALVVSAGTDLLFSTLELTGSDPRWGDRYIFPKAAEAESRSHGFFFQPDADSPNGASGLMGLPVRRVQPRAPGRPSQLLADMSFLRRQDRRLQPRGILTAAPPARIDDGCVASCADWYGNARPIFFRGRVFALLGYELVEGREEGGAIRELRRVDFAPPSPVSRP